MAKPAVPRVCQPCTACCDGWVQIVVDGVPVYPGKPCPHSTGHSCRIYERRPVDPCRNFRCGWIVEGSHLPDWFRPDLAKTIVLPGRYEWRGRPVDLALPVGKRIPGRALNWLKQYAAQSGRPLIYTEQIVNPDGTFSRRQKVFGYGPPGFEEYAQSKDQRGQGFTL